jgi:hypothetical protein
MKDNKTYPISKYVGKHPKGKWMFVKDFIGTYEECGVELRRLQQEDPKTGRKDNQYRIWDDRC